MTQKDQSIRASLWQTRLEKDFDHINWSYRLQLRRPQIRVVCVKSYLGQWDPLLCEIRLAFDLIDNHSWLVVRNILKHEIAHQLVHERIGPDPSHGPSFKRFCEELGVHPAFQKSKANLDLTDIDLAAGRSPELLAYDEESQKLFARVERLLSLAQSQNEHEALTAMAKVNELYEKYNLEQRFHHHKKMKYSHITINLASQKVNAIYPLICSILTEFYFVEVVLASLYNAQLNLEQKTIDIFGSVENLKMAEYVFRFLERQTEELWTVYSRNGAASGKLKRSFQLGLLHGFYAKLSDSKNERHRNISIVSDAKSLLLLQKDPDLLDHVAKSYPRLNRRANQSGGRVYSGAFNHGHSEGRTLVLHKGVEHQGHGLPKRLGFRRILR